MLESHSDRARRVVGLAEEEARSFGHAAVGTEHLLLALLRDPEQSLAAEVLGSVGITYDVTRAQVARVLGRDEPGTPGPIPLTRRLQRVLGIAIGESALLGHEWTGPEHLLLGLAREYDSTAMSLLLENEVDAEQICAELGRLLGVEMRRPVHAQSGPARRRRMLPRPVGDGSPARRFRDRPLTFEAQRVLAHAYREAQHMRHHTAEPEHLLLGLLGEEAGAVIDELCALGLREDNVRPLVGRTARYDDARPGEPSLPSLATWWAVYAAQDAARRLGDNYVSAEHLALGLVAAVDDEKSAGAVPEILARLGVDPGAIREAMERSLSDAPPHRRPPRFPSSPVYRYAVAALGSLGELSAERLGPWGGEGWELVTVVGAPDDLRGIFKQRVH